MKYVAHAGVVQRAQLPHDRRARPGPDRRRRARPRTGRRGCRAHGPRALVRAGTRRTAGQCRAPTDRGAGPRPAASCGGGAHSGRGGLTDARVRALDQDRFERGVLRERPARAGRHARDPVDHVHALDHAAEHRVAPARGRRVERDVVGDVDVELRGAAVRSPRCAPWRACRAGCSGRCRFRSARRRASGFSAAVGQVPAALHDEVADHPVEDRAVVMPVAHVLQEIGGGERRAAGVDLDRERAERGRRCAPAAGRWLRPAACD